MSHISLAIVGAAHPNTRGPARRYGLALCRPGDPLDLRHEPKNPADENAIAVFGHDVQLGYLTAERAPLILKRMRDGADIRCVFQAATAWGGWARCSFDGSVPGLPSVESGDDAAENDDFWPDYLPPDD